MICWRLLGSDLFPMHPLFDLLKRLEAARLHFTLSRHRNDSILVSVAVVGERIEVDVFDDGHMEISRFKGSEAVEGGAELIQEIIRENTD